MRNVGRRVPAGHLLLRPMRPDELPDVRRVWWHQARLGYRLPPEKGVIVLEGGRPPSAVAPCVTGDTAAGFGRA
jgi:hypothetical protein